MNKQKGLQEISQEIRTRLVLLRDTLKEKGIRLSILVMPLLQSYDDWSIEDRTARAPILSMLDELQIETYDLFFPLQRAMKNRINIFETPGDTWHPSTEVSEVFAQFLSEQHLLEEPSKPYRACGATCDGAKP